MKKTLLLSSLILGALAVAVLAGASFYMLRYSLAPDPNRADTDSCYRQLFAAYPETRGWADSLRHEKALRDTFLTMPSGDRHHALFIDRGAERTAVLIHGWRDCAVKYLWLACLYERELGYNVVMPELHACGESEGRYIRMGWKDRLDVKRWMEAFRTDTMAVHGVSMGAATAMMLSGETMPEGIRELRFVEDCGYTSVWDEFACQLKAQFGLPPFPLMHSTSLLCGALCGWRFGEADAVAQVRKCRYPMLFIHGETDGFVPTRMVYTLYGAKPGPKTLWVAPGSGHARSYADHKAEYTQRVREFLRH